MEYAPPDEALWADLKRALSEIPMSLSAHQQMAAVFQGVERQAVMNQMRAAGTVGPAPE